MIDVKKLVGVFLILAAVAVGSGIAVSFLGNSLGTAHVAVGPQVTDARSASDNASPIANAFINTGSIQGNAAEVLADTETTSSAAQATDPNNLTNVFANSFLNGLTAANPNGLTTGQDGSPDFTPPDTDAVAASISSDPAIQNFSAPNWDLEAQSQVITISPVTSSNNITQYNDSLTAIFSEYFLATNLESQLSNQNGDTDLSYLSTEIQGALDSTLAIKTPASLADLQRSLVRVMIYEKEFSQLAENANDDPVRAALTVQAEQPKFTAALADLQDQMQQASKLGLSFNNTPKTSTPLVAELLGVQTAHAQWITFDPTAFGQLVLDAINNAILQILKNTLVSLIQKKVLTAIQGSGAPKFITDWGATMINSFQSAALSTLNSQLALTPSYQQPFLNALLSTPYQAPNGNGGASAAQLNPNNSNLGSGNFTNFSDYLALYGPGGNVWSNAMTIQQNAAAAGANSQAANQAQNIAQQGWNGSATCPAGDGNPNGSHLVCANGNVTYGTCSDGSIPQLIPNAGKCDDGTNPTITSPGQVTGQSMSSALNSGTQNITSADDIVGLLNALTVSLVNTLAQNAINYASQGVNGALTDSGLTGISPSSLNPSTSSSTAAQTAVTCLPSVQPAIISTSTGVAVASLSAGGGAIDSTCAINNDCPSTVNSDGTPIYNWSAAGSVQGGSATGTPTILSGSSLLLSYSASGTYYATVTASTDETQATCEIDVQASP